MRKMTVAMVMVAVGLMLCGCGGGGGYRNIKYEDPGTVVLLDINNNPTDLHQITEKMITSMLNHPNIMQAEKKPVVMVGRVVNRTHEHWDVKSLTDKIRTMLVKSGKFRVVDETARPDLAEEYEYHSSGYVDPETRKGPGKQLGVDWFLRGDIASQVHKGGDTKVVWFKITMQLTDVATNEIIWTEDHEFMKSARKSSWGW